MNGLVSTLNAFVTWAKTPGTALCAVALLVGAYYLLAGGDKGRQTAKNWFIGAVVGLVIIYGADALANSIKGNIKF